MGPWKRIVKNGKWRAQVTPARYFGNQRFGVAVTANDLPIYALQGPLFARPIGTQSLWA